MRLISMSVWGSSRMYWEGALINSRIYKEIYPGWTLRIYTDEQNEFTRELVGNGAQVCLMRNPGGIFGMFWRFIPASDEGLDALIVRDADSRLNVREAAAVEAWLDSGKGAHVMRDHPHHLNWPMLGGMWGIRGGVIPDMKDRILAWNRWEKKLDDMYFLAESVWPVIQHDCLQHVRGTSPFGGEPFPPHGPCSCDYIGQVYYERNVKDIAR